MTTIVPWRNVHITTEAVANAFTLPPRPSEGRILFNNGAWARAYPYGDRCEGPLSHEVVIEGPILEIQNSYVLSKHKCNISALVCLHPPFLRFLETLDAVLKEQIPEPYKNRLFRGLIKKQMDVRLLQFPVTSETPFRNDGNEEITMEHALSQRNHGRKRFQPRIRVRQWYVHRIFGDVRLDVVCDSITVFTRAPAGHMESTCEELRAYHHRYFAHRLLTNAHIDLRTIHRHANEGCETSMMALQILAEDRSLQEEDPWRIEVGEMATASENDGEEEDGEEESGWRPTLIASDGDLLAKVGEQTCTVCLENRRNAVFSPCGHMCACIPCVRSLRERRCPVCRAGITTVVRVYAC